MPACVYVSVYFQSAVKWVIPPPGLRTESNDVEWKRFIEALSPPLTPPLPFSLSLCVFHSRALFLRPSPPSSLVSPSLCFYGGIIILLSHPLLFRSEQNNKFQDHADTAFLQLKLILWTRQKRCTVTHKTTKIVANSCSPYSWNILRYIFLGNHCHKLKQ